MIEESLTTMLTADTGMAAMISGRVYGGMAPQGVRAPYVVFNLAGAREGSTYCASDGIKLSIFMFDSYAKTFKEVKLTAKALRSALIDFHGLVGDTHIKTIKLESEVDINDTDLGILRVLTTLSIWHEAT